MTVWIRIVLLFSDNFMFFVKTVDILDLMFLNDAIIGVIHTERLSNMQQTKFSITLGKLYFQMNLLATPIYFTNLSAKPLLLLISGSPIPDDRAQMVMRQLSSPCVQVEPKSPLLNHSSSDDEVNVHSNLGKNNCLG